MVTGYEAGAFREFSVLVQSMRSIERSLSTIAGCMEAEELRRREREKEDAMYTELAGQCWFEDCPNPVAMMLNGERFCRQHIDAGFARMKPAFDAVKAGFNSIEES